MCPGRSGGERGMLSFSASLSQITKDALGLLYPGTCFTGMLRLVFVLSPKKQSFTATQKDLGMHGQAAVDIRHPPSAIRHPPWRRANHPTPIPSHFYVHPPRH
eukprot:scaffold7381_cov310-Pinguiococcus_pyrenoidosus.AAC.118